MSILRRLDAGRIFSASIGVDGYALSLYEECDRYFSVHLNKAEGRELVAELAALVEQMSE